ncbi:MAG: sigma-70 family RNA polymerase sigma factor [bacterium]
MNESQDLLNQSVYQVNSDKGWNLSKQCLNELVKAVLPYIDPTDDSTIIKRKIIYYYEYSVDVKALQQHDSSTIERYQIYIIKVIRRYFQNLPRNYEVEDLVNESWIVIIKKLEKYKYASKLTVYLYPLIIRKVLEVIRRLKKEEKYVTVSTSDPINTDDGSDTLTIEDSLETEEPGPEISFECKELSEIVDELLQKEIKHYMKRTNLSPEIIEQLVLRIFVLGELGAKYAQRLDDTADNLYTRRCRFKKDFQQLYVKKMEGLGF